MIGKITLRQATAADAPAVRELTTKAFGRPDEAAIIEKLEADDAVYLQVVAEMDGQIVGHVLFYPVGVRGKLSGLGLGPMSVDPWVQKEGIGKSMAQYGLKACEEAKVPIVFVLGHPEYYPKLGFSQDAAKEFESPWPDNPAFMAIRLRYGPPMSGQLIFPKAFGV